MPKLEIELDDKGEFIGTVPPELDAVLKKLEASTHTSAFGKGVQKAAEEAKQQIADAIAAEKRRLELEAPLERQKWSEIDDLNKSLKTQIGAMDQDHRKTLTAREEAHAAEVTKRVAALDVRNKRIQLLVNQNLRALAAQNGAREESLGELEVLLQSRIGYDDNMEPFVRDEQDPNKAARTAAGSALGIDVFVKQYLDGHPHHRKAASGRGGDARGGASLRGGSFSSAGSTAEAAAARIDRGDRSADAVNDLYQATRPRRSA